MLASLYDSLLTTPKSSEPLLLQVNSWSASEQTDIIQEMFELELPFDAPEFSNGQFRAGAVAVFLRVLARKAHQVGLLTLRNRGYLLLIPLLE